MAIISLPVRDACSQALWELRAEFGAVAVFSMVINLLMLVPTLYLMQVFDRVLVSRSELTLLALSLVALFLFGLMAWCERSRSRVLVQAGLQLDEQLGARVFRAGFGASLQAEASRTGQAGADLLVLRQFVTGPGVFALFDAPWAPVYIAVTFLLHPLLGVVTLGFVLLQVALAVAAHRSGRAPEEAAGKAAAEVQAFVKAKLRHAEAVEALGMLPNLRRRWRELQNAWLERAGHAQERASRYTVASRFLRYSHQTLALAAGALLVIDGQLSPGTMIAVNLLMNRALAPIDQAVAAWPQVLGVRSAWRRLAQLLAEHPEADPGQVLPRPAGAVRLGEVEARARGRDTPVLQGISLEVPAGTLVAVVGPSGAGKSTLARVLTGCWPDVSGQVLLDGAPRSAWDRAALGRYLGYLPQDVELFEGTIAENIARLDEVDSAQVIAAARACGLHETILRLPQGYDTPIGDAGRLLSGGQRQRIGLARALYGDPSLLVLDEPEASLDEAGEAALRRALLQLKERGRTVFLVTQLRSGLVSLADQVLLMQGGRLCMQGSAESVVALLRALQTGPAPSSPGLPAAQAT